MGVQSEKQVGTGAVRKKRLQVFLPGVGRKGVAFADFGRGKMTAGRPSRPARPGFGRNLEYGDRAFDMMVLPGKAGAFGRETGPGHLAAIDIVVDAGWEGHKGRFLAGEKTVLTLVAERKAEDGIGKIADPGGRGYFIIDNGKAGPLLGSADKLAYEPGKRAKLFIAIEPACAKDTGFRIGGEQDALPFQLAGTEDIDRTAGSRFGIAPGGQGAGKNIVRSHRNKAGIQAHGHGCQQGRQGGALPARNIGLTLAAVGVHLSPAIDDVREALLLCQPRLQVRQRLAAGAAQLGTGFNHLDADLAEGQGRGLTDHLVRSYDTDCHGSLRFMVRRECALFQY